MHIEYRKVGKKPYDVRFIWYYKYGFGVWIFGRLFGIGHDTRSREVTV